MTIHIISKRWVNSAEIKSLGAGVFLTGALFNHSCDPSFMRCNVGKVRSYLQPENTHKKYYITQKISTISMCRVW